MNISQYLYPVLFVFIVITNISCTPPNEHVDTSFAEQESLETQNSHTRQDNTNQEQKKSEISYNEQQKRLLLNQDYKGALDLMPQVENEMLEQGIPHQAVRCFSKNTYCYLYMALGRDDDALQKIMEYELSSDIDPTSKAIYEYDNHYAKVIVMSRLNMTNEVINETNAYLGDINAFSALLEKDPYLCVSTLFNLLAAQLINEDIKSAQDSIYRIRKLLESYSTPTEQAQQLCMRFYEVIRYVEYYINTLTETHSVRFTQGKLKPVTRDTVNPDNVDYELPRFEWSIFSKIDSCEFTFDNFRKVTAKPLHDPFLE